MLTFSWSCLRLDDNLYNNDNSISSYKLDNYLGEIDFELDSNYTIPDSLIHIFTLTSNDNGDKAEIYAIYIGDTARISSDTVIMYCHGNKDHMDFYWQRAKLLANVGGKNRFGVLMIDYREFGLSEGTCTESGIYADVNAALNWLKENGLSDDRLVIYGFSLGSAPATKTCAENFTMKPSKLILESPFASAEVMVHDGTGMAIPSTYFTNLKIDNAEKIKKVSQPFLWIHGINDAFLSMKTHGEVIYKNYDGIYSQAERVPKADHGDVPNTMGFEEYKTLLHNFITTEFVAPTEKK